MDNAAFLNICRDIRKLLSEERLSEAITSTEAILDTSPDWNLKQQLEQVKSAYAMMLRFVANGTEDEGREKMFHSFIRNVHEVTDQLLRSFLVKHDNGAYGSTARFLNHLENKPSWEQGIFKDNISPRILFEVTFVAPFWSENNLKDAETFILEKSNKENLRPALFISAVTLSLLHVFDARKFSLFTNLLLFHKSAISPSVLARIVTGIAFVSIVHNERFKYYPEFSRQIGEAFADSANKDAFLTLQMQLLVSLEAKKIAQSIQQEIIPEIMKHATRAKRGSVTDIAELERKFAEEGFAPDWDLTGKDSLLGKKMRDIIAQQSRGADVYFSTFSFLKQRFAFFKSPSGWFSPFSLSNPDISVTPPSWLRKLMSMQELCSSDRYSLLFVLSEMPAAQRELLEKTLPLISPSEGMEDSELTEVETSGNFEDELRFYLQDTYRYFSLYPGSDQSVNPFAADVLLQHNALFKPEFSRLDTLSATADFAFAEKNFALALPMLVELFSNEERGETCQKIAFCHQRLGQYGSAIEAYLKSELLLPGSNWTWRQLVTCCRATGRYEEELKYHTLLHDEESDNVAHLLSVGECLIRLERFEEALNALHKADYIGDSTQRAGRGIAWCQLRLLNFEKACSRYEKLLSSLTETQAEDFLNAGHANLLSGRTAEAVNLYGIYVDMVKGTSETDVTDIFSLDAGFLISAGISPTFLHLVNEVVMQGR